MNDDDEIVDITSCNKPSFCVQQHQATDSMAGTLQAAVSSHQHLSASARTPSLPQHQHPPNSIPTQRLTIKLHKPHPRK